MAENPLSLRPILYGVRKLVEIAGCECEDGAKNGLRHLRQKKTVRRSISDLYYEQVKASWEMLLNG